MTDLLLLVPDHKKAVACLPPTKEFVRCAGLPFLVLSRQREISRSRLSFCEWYHAIKPALLTSSVRFACVQLSFYLGRATIATYSLPLALIATFGRMRFMKGCRLQYENPLTVTSQSSERNKLTLLRALFCANHPDHHLEQSGGVQVCRASSRLTTRNLL